MITLPKHSLSNRHRLKLFIERLFSSILGVSAWISPKSTYEDVKGLVCLFRPCSVGLPLIRLGAKQDGGYLLPDDLSGIRNCVSPGVDQTASFELDLAKLGIKSHLADYSVISPPEYLVDCTFTRKFLASYDSSSTLTLESWLAEQNLQNDTDMVLQMDIEGAEYEVISSANLEVLKQFRVIVIEFHELHHIANPIFLMTVRGVLQKLMKDFVIVHIHPNNCVQCVNVRGVLIPPLLEVTFLRRDRVVNMTEIDVLPHPLDYPNLPSEKDIRLQRLWMSG